MTLSIRLQSTLRAHTHLWEYSSVQLNTYVYRPRDHMLLTADRNKEKIKNFNSIPMCMRLLREECIERDLRNIPALFAGMIFFFLKIRNGCWMVSKTVKTGSVAADADQIDISRHCTAMRRHHYSHSHLIPSLLLSRALFCLLHTAASQLPW